MLTVDERVRALLGNLKNNCWEVTPQFRIEREDAEALRIFISNLQEENSQLRSFERFSKEEREEWHLLGYKQGYRRARIDAGLEEEEQVESEEDSFRIMFCTRCFKIIEESDPHIIAYKNGIPAPFCREHIEDSKRYLDWFQEIVPLEKNEPLEPLQESLKKNTVIER